MTVLKTLQYPLRTMTLLETECNRIIQPVLDAGLTKARPYAESFPKW
jgi:hypothetical protein